MEHRDIRILHCGEITLGNPHVDLSILRCRECSERFYRVFDSLMDYIREEKIDLVLFPGNLMGTCFSNQDARYLIDAFSALPDTTFVISPGPEDPYGEGSIYLSERLPKNVLFFTKPVLDVIEPENLPVMIYGFACCKHRKPAEGQPAGIDRAAFAPPIRGRRVKKTERLTLLSCTCSFEKMGGIHYPITMQDLTAFSADYAALSFGRTFVPRENTSPLFGCASPLEGKRFEECGKSTFFRLDVSFGGERPAIKLREVSFSRHRYETFPMDVTGITELAEILPGIEAVAKNRGYGEDTSLRVFLTGEVEPTVDLHYDSELPPPFPLYSLEFCDRTKPTFGTDHLKRDMTVKGEFYRTTLEKIGSTQKEEDIQSLIDALRIGLIHLDAGDGSPL